MVTPKKVRDLVERFEEHKQYYKENSSEEDIKNEFINPLFEALGWDVFNKNGKPPYLKEVFFNKTLKTKDGKTFNPDYTFSAEGDSKFFVEVLKPSRNLENNKKFSKQVIDHGYGLGLPLSIITNFEKLIVYDTRYPSREDNDKNKIKLYNYRDFDDKWNEIRGYFSKKAVDDNQHLNILPDETVTKEPNIKENNQTNSNKSDNLDKSNNKTEFNNLNKLDGNVQGTESSIINKINEKGTVIREIPNLHNHSGIVLPKKEVFVIDNQMKEDFILEDPKNSKIIKPLLLTENIIDQNIAPDKFLLNTKTDINIQKEYPIIYNYFKKYQSELEKRTNIGIHWYNFKTYPKVIDRPKIAYAGRRNYFISYLDYKGLYFLTHSEYFIYHENDDLFILKILNSILSSNLMDFYVKTLKNSKYSKKSFDIYRVIKDIPIIEISKNDLNISQLSNIIDKLEEEKENKNKLENDLEYSSNIQKLDEQINKIVYELYDITPEEINFIESNSSDNKIDSKNVKTVDKIVEHVKKPKNPISDSINNSSTSSVNKINTSFKPTVSSIKNKIKKKGTFIEQSSQVYSKSGIVLPQKETFIIDEKMKDDFIIQDPNNSKIIKPLILTDDILNHKNPSGNYLINTKTNIDIQNKFPIIYNYLKKFKSELEKRSNTGIHWYNVQTFPKDIVRPKIVYAARKKFFTSFIDYEGIYYLTHSEYFIYHEHDDLSVLKILNVILSSDLMDFYIKTLINSKHDVKYYYIYNAIRELPIIDINKDNPKISKLNNLIENLEEEKQNLETHEKSLEESTSKNRNETIKDEINELNNHIQKLDNQINQAVYELYDISPQEIKLIEKNLGINDTKQSILESVSLKKETANNNSTSDKSTSKKQKSVGNKLDSNDLKNSEIKNKMIQKGTLFKDIGLFHHNGIIFPKKDVFLIDKKMRDDFIEKDSKNSKIIEPVLEPVDIQNQNSIPEHYIINTKTDINIQKEYPVIYNYLKSYKSELEKRLAKGSRWYNVKKYPENLDKPKIIYPWLSHDFIVYFDNEGKYRVTNNTYYITKENDEFYLKILTSLLSSNLIKFYIKSTATSSSSGKTFNFSKALKDTPIIDINKDDSRINQLNNLIDEINNEKHSLEQFKNVYNDTKSSKKRKALKSQIFYINDKIQQLNNQINDIVYDLYDITNDEKQIIEKELDSKS